MDQTCDETISNLSNYIYRGHRDRMQSVTITTDVVILNLDQGEVYNIIQKRVVHTNFNIYVVILIIIIINIVNIITITLMKID
jgi:hypothetical protein